MSATAEKLALRLEKESEKNQAFFKDIPATAWEKQVYADGAAWDVGNLLTHIVEAEDSVLRLIQGVVTTGQGAPEDFDLDAYNERKVQKITDTAPAALIAKFTARRAKTVAAVQGFSEEDLQKEGRHPFLGHVKVAEMVKLMYLHVQLHIRDIKRVLDE